MCISVAQSVGALGCLPKDWWFKPTQESSSTILGSKKAKFIIINFIVHIISFLLTLLFLIKLSFHYTFSSTGILKPTYQFHSFCCMKKIKFLYHFEALETQNQVTQSNERERKTMCGKV